MVILAMSPMMTDCPLPTSTKKQSFKFSIKVKCVLYHRLIVKAASLDDAKVKAAEYIDSNQDITICKANFINEVGEGRFHDCEAAAVDKEENATKDQIIILF